ncbi:MAG: hypothetical protein METHAR1v1_880006 [Methanothrix sp.]|nr:MAG: hypothetical protein METHAR1v1_880006 [Methanothrix sp.]
MITVMNWAVKMDPSHVKLTQGKMRRRGRRIAIRSISN